MKSRRGLSFMSDKDLDAPRVPAMSRDLGLRSGARGCDNTNTKSARDSKWRPPSEPSAQRHRRHSQTDRGVGHGL